MLKTDKSNNTEDYKSLTCNVQYLKGVGPYRAKLLHKMGILTVEDLLTYFPRKHFDRSQIKGIREVQIGKEETIQGFVEHIRERQTRKVHILEALIRDETGSITCIWFGQSYLKKSIRVGDEIIVSGKIDVFRQIQIKPKEFEIIPRDDYIPIHTKGFIPVYTVTDGISKRQLRRLIWNAINKYGNLLQEIIPYEFLEKHRLMDISTAIHQMHFPENKDSLYNARKRLVYEELFLMQVFLALRRMGIRQLKKGTRLIINNELDFRIRRLFPFKLTQAQEKVIQEIRKDTCQEKPMNRLLQGDVGSGKTIVAIYALLSAVGNHFQSAIMAPTELLAEQHYNTISKLLGKSKVRLCLLRSGFTQKQRKEIINTIKDGQFDLVIGTHAVIQKDVEFKNLALVVIDEQHKFGVMQRAALRAKGLHPHTLVMTATPIPRTLSLTLFGDLDVSIIDELPPGRKPIRTIFRPSHKIRESFEFIKNKIREGRQVYFVYPLIDESDKLPIKSATKMFKFLKEIFSGFNVALLHGEMTKDEKDSIMRNFRDGKINILVSTIVIEVGIDVPNATIMVIENAERYGLAQLHQLRGRIGRGGEESYCLLFGDPKTEEAKRRLSIMVETTDGFKIAEEDLRLRGPGEFFGTRQSGLPELKVANIIDDFSLLLEARKDAFSIVVKDPYLTSSRNTVVKEALKHKYKERLGLISIG